jgi:hypothetical protein
MGDVILDLLPLMASAAVVPLYLIVVVFLLHGGGGLTKALAFVAGGIATRLAQGLLFGLVFGAARAGDSAGDLQSSVSTLQLIIGIMLLITAVKKWQEEDYDTPPRWMTAISDFSAVKAAGTGALFVMVVARQWVFTLSAIGIISEAGLGKVESTGLYLFYVLATQTLVLAPILVMAVVPQQSAKPLTAAQIWLERHGNAIVVTVSLVFGAWFLYTGIAGFVG